LQHPEIRQNEFRLECGNITHHIDTAIGMRNGVIGEAPDDLHQSIVVLHVSEKIRGKLCRPGFPLLQSDNIHEFDRRMDRTFG
jgi:hypothetical protein